MSAQEDLIQGKTVTYKVELDLHGIAHALEDLPEDARVQAAECYRMAVMGWSAADALAEAERFGCSVPMQLAFIQAFGAQLETQYQVRVSNQPLPDVPMSLYPLLPPGSVVPTAQELAATVAAVALLEAGRVQ